MPPPGFALQCWGCESGGVLRAPRGPFLQVSVAGDGHACAIASDYSLVCWGSYIGPMGGEARWNGTYVQVAASEGLSCALRGDGSLFCVGEAARLWSGRPSRGRRDLPQPLPKPPPRNAQFAEITAQCVGGLQGGVCGCLMEGVGRQAQSHPPLPFQRRLRLRHHSRQLTARAVLGRDA